MSYKIENSNDLYEFLRTWMSGEDDTVYDFSSMCEFLGACLDNLDQYALDAELEEISDCLTEQQVVFLKKLASYAK
jgi:hypothetical protein